MGCADVASLTERRERRSGRSGDDDRDRTSRMAPRGSLRAATRVAVVHPDPTWRDDVATALAAEDLVVVAADGADAIAAAGVDVVVVAHRQPGTSAVEICERLRGLSPCPAFVVVASETRAVLLRRVVQAGATAFVAAESPPTVLREAVRAVAAGRPYFDPAISHCLLDLIARTPSDRRPYGLTRAQLDVVALLPKGLPNREIAAELGISENTVKTHLRHALRKLKVRDRAQAAALVVREGLT